MKIKGIYQHDELDCGPACLTTICRYYHIHISMQIVREYSNTDLNGTTIFGLIKAAERIGLNANSYVTETEEFYEAILKKKIQLPIIVHINQSGLLHYIVVYKINSGKVKAFDPAIGKVEYTKKDFNEIFTGYFISFISGENKKKYKISKEEVNYKLLYKKIVLENSHLYIMMVLFSIFFTVFTLLFSYIYKKVIDTFITESTANVYKNLLLFLLILIVMNIIRLSLQFLKENIICKKNRKLNEKLHEMSLNLLLKNEMTFFETRNVGDLMSRFTDIEEIVELFINIPDLFIYSTISIILYLFFLLRLNSKMFCVSLVILFLYGFLTFVFTTKLHKVLLNITLKYADMITSFKEVISGIFSIKTLAAENFYKEKLLNKVKLFLKNINVLDKLLIFQNSSLGVMQSIGELLIWLVGVTVLVKNEISLGSLILFVNITNLLLEEISNLIKLQKNIQQGIVSIHRMEDIYVAKSENENVLDEDAIVKFEKIEFENVYFRYGFNEDILRGVNLNIRKGERIGIVGKSGSGKTTLFKLLLGYYSLCSGYIRINDKNIETISTQTIRNIICYIPQESIVFDDTLKNNIMCGNNSSLEEINKIIHICRIGEFMEKLPDGIESKVDANMLSSGEKQRLGLARALIKKPQVIILDESTSNLDFVTSKEIIEEIHREYTDITIIHIVHRLEILDYCETIYQVENGEIQKIKSFL